MSFRMVSGVGPGMGVLDWVHVPQWEGGFRGRKVSVPLV